MPRPRCKLYELRFRCRGCGKLYQRQICIQCGPQAIIDKIDPTPYAARKSKGRPKTGGDTS